MPVTKSARKKLQQDKKKEVTRAKVQNLLRDLIKKARKAPSVETIKAATKAADKSVKIHIIHKNKAARIKSSLAKLVAASPVAKTATKKKTATK